MLKRIEGGEDVFAELDDYERFDFDDDQAPTTPLVAKSTPTPFVRRMSGLVHASIKLDTMDFEAAHILLVMGK